MASQPLQYDVYVTEREALPTPSLFSAPDGEPPYWSPISSTLIYGDTEAALIDPAMTVAQAERIAAWVARVGRRLAFIYITHGHGDHWYGTQTILRRFPDAKVYATEGVIEEMRKGSPDGKPSALFAEAFPGKLSETPVVAEPVSGEALTVDGHRLHAVEVGHSDADNSTVLHVPSIGLVVAGDVIYNNVHQFVGESANGGLEAWLAAVDMVALLAPRAVVAGHKDARRGDDPSIVGATRSYLEAAGEILAGNPTREEYFSRVVARYPDRLNPGAAWLSAVGRIPAAA